MSNETLDLEAIEARSEGAWDIAVLVAEVRRLRAENERLTFIDWRQRQDWLVASTERITAERDENAIRRDEARGSCIAEAQRANAAEAEHGRAVAALQRVEAIDYAADWVTLDVIRAAIKGEDE
jgi:hypothetical protein